MSQPVTTTVHTAATSQQPQDYNSPAQLFFGTALSAGTTALAAGIFTAISPLGGAIFGATSFLSGRLIHWICDKVNCCPDSMVAQVGKTALALIGGIGAAAAVTTFAGFPMTFAAGAILTITTAAAMVGAGLCLAGCISIPVIAGLAIGMNAAGQNTAPVRA